MRTVIHFVHEIASLGMDGSYNVAYGLDGISRLFGDDYLTLKWAQTFETGMQNDPLSMSPSRILAILQRRNEEGFAYDLAYSRSGEEFNPGIGFEMVEDYSVIRGIFQYGWLPGEKSKLQSHKIMLTAYRFNRLPEETLKTVFVSPGWSFNSKNNWNGTFSLDWTLEDLEDSISFAYQADVPDDRYEFLNLKALLSTPGSYFLKLGLMLEAGSFYDGRKFTLNLEPGWDVSPSFELKGTYRYDWVSFSGRDQGFSNHIVGMKALCMLNTKISAAAFIQYNIFKSFYIMSLSMEFNILFHIIK